jgi:flagellar hook-length control protein FliK
MGGGSGAGGAVDSGLVPIDNTQVPVADAAALMALLASSIPQANAGLAGGNTAALTAQGASTLSLAQGGSLAGLQDRLQASLQAEFLPPGGLVAQTARLDGALDASALDGQNPVAGYRRAFSRLQGVLSSGLAGASTAALAASQRLAVSDKSSLASTSTALATAPGLQAVPERREAVLAGVVAPRTGLEVAAASAPGAQAGNAPALDALAQARATGDKAAPEGLTDVWGGASAGPDALALASPDAGSPLTEPGQAAAEDALAEQVAYWVSENLQNAELTVTHDGKPVEVSVSMSGKEAHIVFGSDQSETRDLLDASVAQLRDLLHGEGLTLSGMTVGESGARNTNADSGGDSPRGRQGTRQAQVLVPTAEMGVSRARVLTDRAVDLFV